MKPRAGQQLASDQEGLHDHHRTTHRQAAEIRVVAVTDARFPERWLNDRRVMLLDPVDFRAFVLSLAWSTANRSDGVITAGDLPLMSWLTPDSPGRLVAARVWSSLDNGWLIDGFADTQTTSAELDGAANARRKDAERQRRNRQHLRDVSAGHPGIHPDVHPDVRRDVHPESSRPGQDRPGQAELDPADSETSDQLERCEQCGKPTSSRLFRDGQWRCRACHHLDRDAALNGRPVRVVR